MDRQLIRRLREDIERHEAEIARHQAELARLRDFLTYYLGEDAERAIRPRRGRGPNQRPTVKTYIEKALDEHPGQHLSVAQIRDGARRAGWTSGAAEPDTVIRTNLRRLMEDGVVERDAEGRYHRAAKTDRSLPPIQDGLAASTGGG